MKRLENLDYLTELLKTCRVTAPIGRVESVSRGQVTVGGFGEKAAIGDIVHHVQDLETRGEVIRVSEKDITVALESGSPRLCVGDRMAIIGRREIRPDESWLGRVIDSDGKPLDDRELLSGLSGRPLESSPPKATERRGLGPRLRTGYAMFDTLLPIVRGQRLGVFSGSGVGKSTLMAAFASGMDADVVVIALVGERGREVTHFINSVLGPRGLRKSIVVAATSDRSAPERRRAALTAMAIAEHFRDTGAHVLLMIDSVTRIAEAHREIAGSSGEAMTLRGYPASMVQLLSGLAERAGPGRAGQGDITALFTVLVAGSDMEEPVADTMRGILDGHIILSRKVAERGRFPAVDILQSVSRALPDAADDNQLALIKETRRLLSVYASSEMMIRSGLYTGGADPDLDHAVALHDPLERFFTRRSADGIDAAFKDLAAVLTSSTEAVPETEEG